MHLRGSLTLTRVARRAAKDLQDETDPAAQGTTRSDGGSERARDGFSNANRAQARSASEKTDQLEEPGGFIKLG
jgi:hypothetical protein